MVELYAGTYDKGGGRGLTALTFSPEEGWTVGEAFGLARNASFGAYSQRFDLHYLVDEQADGAVGTYRKTATGWEQVGRVSAAGAEPCYASLDATEQWLAVANYKSGSVAMFALNAGIPDEAREVRQNEGCGPVSDRQDGPHAHCALFGPSGQWLYHVDLGTDEVLTHPLEHDGLGERTLAYNAPPGTGPRHLVFHPSERMALLVSELAATLTVLDVAEPQLSVRRTVPTAPPDYSGENLGGHLQLNAAGDRAYVTNRGHDSIAVFAFDRGELTLLQHVLSGGASPRFFLLLEAERLLILANEEGGNVTAFRIEPDGRLAPLPGDCPLPGVVFLTQACRS